MYKKMARIFSVALCTLFLSACGVIDYFYLPPPQDTAQEIFESANEAMADKSYLKAIKLYEKLRDAYPFSPYTIDAELSLADAYFLDGEYVAAAEAYKDFEALHPRHEAVPYCLYQMGMSNLKSFRSIDRATTQLSEAHAAFKRLTTSYPDSIYAEGAKEGMARCRKLMAEHELYIADMFMSMKDYGPAWKRYEYVQEHYTDVPEISSHAEEKSKKAYQAHRQKQSEEVRRETHGSWKDWFKWL